MLFPFVQFEFTHAIGPEQGRYVVMPPAEAPALLDELDLSGPGAGAATADAGALLGVSAGDEESDIDYDDPHRVTGVTRGQGSADVLVVTVLGAPAARPRSLFSRRAPEVASGQPPAEVPLAIATVVKATLPLDDSDQARAWLEGSLASPEDQDDWIADALEILNRAVRAYRVAAGDPYVVDLTRIDARAIRVGYGNGRDVSEGHWRAAFLAHNAPPRVKRIERLKPAEVVAAALGERTPILDSDELVLRAVLDLDQERPRAAAFQARAALELLPSELARHALSPPLQARVTALSRRQAKISEICRRALSAPLQDADVTEVSELVEEIGHVLMSFREATLS